MSNKWELTDSIKRTALKRIVEDGNLLQSLISQLDLQLSTGQETKATDTLSFMLIIISQMDSHCTSLENALNI